MAQCSLGSMNSGNHDEHSSFIQAIREGDMQQLHNILKSITQTSKGYQLLFKSSNSGQYPLHYTLSDINLGKRRLESRIHIVREIVDQIKPGDLLKYFKLRSETTHRCTALHTAAEQDEVDVVSLILDSLSSKESLELIEMEDGRKQQVLDYTLSPQVRNLIETFKSSQQLSNSENNEESSENLDWTDVNYIEAINIDNRTADNLDSNESDFEMVFCPFLPDSTAAAQTSEFITAEDALKQIQTLVNIVKEENNFGTPLKMKNKKGMTILHIAAMKNRLDDVRLLLTAIPRSKEHWELISQTCQRGKTALHYASQMAFVDIVKELLSHCPNEDTWNLLTVTCCCQKTAFHYACIAQAPDVARVLLHYSYERDLKLIHLKDKNEKTGRKYANIKVLQKLLSMVETHYWKTLEKPPTVLIFYNDFNNYPKRRRDGAVSEMEKMKEAFRSCGMAPDVHPNFTEELIKRRIGEAVTKEGIEISALIVVIMSHGEDGIVFDANNAELRLKNLIHIMCDEFKSKMKFLPKVLFLQSCMEDSDEELTDSRAQSQPSPRPSANRNQFDAAKTNNKPTSDFLSKYDIPASEFCLITSTLGGHTSVRGYFAEKLASVTCRRGGPTNLIEIYRAVHRAMDFQQVPVWKGALSRELILKKPEEPSLFCRFKNLFKTHDEVTEQ